MAKASLVYGAYTFDPTPRVGEGEEYIRSVDGGSPRVIRTLTATQHFKDLTTYSSNRAKLEALLASATTQPRTLVWNDGAVNRVNQLAWVQRIESPPQWGQKTLTYTVVFGMLMAPPTWGFGALTCTLTTDAGVLTLSTYPPTYAESLTNERVRIKAKPRRQAITVTLRGNYKGANRAANEAFMASIRLHMKQTSGTLVYGGQSNTVYPGAASFAEMVPDLDVNYELTFIYYVESYSPANATFVYTGPTTLTLTDAAISQSGSVKRSGPISDHEGMVLNIALTGDYYGANLAANEAFRTSLEAAMQANSGVLTYGGITYTAYPDGFEVGEIVTSECIPWTARFVLILAAADAPANILEFHTEESMSPVVQKAVWHNIPNRTGSIKENMGLSDFNKTYSGYYIGTTLANARTAALAHKATFQAGGTLLPGGRWDSNERENKIEFNLTYRYNAFADISAAEDLRTPGV